MPTVYLDNPNNSTMFTTCCNVAICDHQEKCPKCGATVTPWDSKGRWIAAYKPFKRSNQNAM